MMEKQEKRYQLLAALLTLLITVATLYTLITTHLHCSWTAGDAALAQQQQLAKQDSIMFGGEYVMLGDTPEPSGDDNQPAAASADEPAVTTDEEPQSSDAADIEDAGKPAKQQAGYVTQRQPSPMKVTTPPHKVTDKPAATGPATAANPKAKVERDRGNGRGNGNSNGRGNAVANRMKNAFGSGRGNGSGRQGSPNGNSATGKVSGRPGVGGLDGFTLAYWGRPRSIYAGTVVVRVRVNARGKVIEAHATGGTIGNAAVRRNCEQESLKSAFSVPKSNTREGFGTIIWRFV